MKTTQLLTALIAILAGRLSAADNVTLKAPIADIAVATNSAIAPIDLRNHFEVTDVQGTVVHFDTNLGEFDVEMFDSTAPNTVTNFLRYVNEGRYANSFFHRSDSTFNVLQGGGFLVDTDLSEITPLVNCSTTIGSNIVTCESTAQLAIGMTVTGFPIPSGTTITSIGNPTTFAISAVASDTTTGERFTTAYPPIPLELTNSNPNTRGRIAMARASGVLDSATREWFINTADNSAGFDPASNPGGNPFSVFGRVIGAGMNVVDAIRALPTFNDFGFPFYIPYVGTLPPAGQGIFLSNLIRVDSMTSGPVFPTANGQNSFVRFSLTNTNPVLVSAIITGSTLNLALAPNRGGAAKLRVNATDSAGVQSDLAFNLNVTGGIPTAYANSDCNGDTLNDLVLQNGVGQLAAWFLDGTGNAVNFSTGAGLKPGSKILYSAALADWRMAATSDINTDGFTDLLFQNGVGQIVVWFLDGTGNAINFSTGVGLKPGSKVLYSGGLADWRVVAISDINSDGFTDLVMQNNFGQIFVWTLDGTGNAINFSTGAGLMPGTRLLYSGGLADWRVVAAGDINSDGFTDLVMQNNFGQIFVWTLDGTGNAIDFSNGAGLKPGTKLLYPGGLADWRVVMTKDINSDGFTDFLFQNGLGQLVVWFLDGTGNAVDFSTGAGLKPGSGLLYSAPLGDWRVH